MGGGGRGGGCAENGLGDYWHGGGARGVGTRGIYRDSFAAFVEKAPGKMKQIALMNAVGSDPESDPFKNTSVYIH